MKFASIAKITAVLCITFNPGLAFAEFQGIGNKEGLTLGIGNISDWSAYKNSDSPSSTTIPYIAYDWENAHIGVEGFSYDFFSKAFGISNQLSIELSIEPRWTFTDPEDSTQFENIKRDTALEAGVSVTTEFAGLSVTAAYLEDISGVHDGSEASLELGLEIELGSLEAGFSIGYIQRDKSLNLHLYGVKKNEATATVAPFSPNASGFPFIESQWTLPLGKRNALIAFAKYEQLPTSIEKSPLIDQDYNASVGVLVLRRF